MKPTIAERDHMRGALNSMTRNADGRVQINPGSGQGFTGTARFGMRRNAQRKVVEGLLAKGWLTEHNGRFTVTPAGRAALDGETNAD